jgi:PhnB protein
MAIKKLNPYLNFPGTAKKAIQLYETALGAKTENVMPCQDMPGVPAESV